MTEQLPFNTAPLPVKLRVEDYLLLDRSGAFDAYAKTELIDGEILFMNAQHRPHAYLKTELAYLLRRAAEAIASNLYPIVEGSVAMPPHSVPEPDIALTTEPHGEGPIPFGSLALVVEVADATLHNDLGRKANLYAAAYIPEYWVVDVNGRVIHQLWCPGDEGYAEHRRVPFGSRIDAASIDGLSVETAGL